MPSHNRPRLFKFLEIHFSNEDVTNFCFNHFPKVYDEFPTGMLKSPKIRMLVEYAENNDCLSKLYAALEQERPKAYGVAFPDEDPADEIVDNFDGDVEVQATEPEKAPDEPPVKEVPPRSVWEWIVNKYQALDVAEKILSIVASIVAIITFLVGFNIIDISSFIPSSATVTPAVSTPVQPVVTETPVTITPTIEVVLIADSDGPPMEAELGNTWTRPKDGMMMVYVPSPNVPFVLESGVDAPTEGFWIDKYEVSNAQYQLCVDAGVCEPARFMDDDNFNGADYPVVGVSAFNAEVYSAWVGGVLPTEAEWEYAAVGNSGFDYPWGNKHNSVLLNYCDVNCWNPWKDDELDDRYITTAPVDSFIDGISWVGAVNFAGNVWEWTSSDDESGTLRSIRGGSWGDNTESAQSYFYSSVNPEIRNSVAGFRVAFRNEIVGYPLVPSENSGQPVSANLGDTWTRAKDGMMMVYVPPASVRFALESGVYAPRKGYWIDKYEVSNAQYQLCVDAGVCEPSAYNYDNFNGAEYPVVGVSAFDADVYSEWVGGALPTEAEWEYAAVGNSRDAYPWGNMFDLSLLNCDDDYCDDDYLYTAPVDSFSAGASWVGAFNMAGNVWEWTASWETGECRVLRGGSWARDHNFARASYRYYPLADSRTSSYGFRVVVPRSSAQ